MKNSMNLGIIIFLVLSVLSIGSVGASYSGAASVSKIHYQPGNNNYVTKYISTETYTNNDFVSPSGSIIADVYNERAINNPIYLKYNTLETLKLGYQMSLMNPNEVKKSCSTVRVFNGPSYQGFRGAQYKTICKSTRSRR